MQTRACLHAGTAVNVIPMCVCVCGLCACVRACVIVCVCVFEGVCE